MHRGARAFPGDRVNVARLEAPKDSMQRQQRESRLDPIALASKRDAMAESWDPVTLRIIWDRLISTTFEVGRTLEKAAFSIVVREGKDYAVIITDSQGNCIAQPWDCTPVFLGTLPLTIRHFLSRYPAESLRPGDSLITNDPWMGTGHLSDISIATPIFDRNGKLFSFVACTAHMTDIGGRMDFGATREIYEEGLLIPISKLENQGAINTDLLAIVERNVRVPKGVIGDIMAMLAANRVAAARLVALVEANEIHDFDALGGEIIGRTEAAMREAISGIPDGVYRSSVSGDGFVGPFTIEVELRVGNGEVIVDFDGTSPETASSLNSVLAYTTAFTAFPLKSLLHPRLPNNEGTFRPIHVSAPEGSILNARHPVAVNNRNLVGHFITPAILRALATAVPDRVIAESGSTPAQFETFTGVDAYGERFVQFFAHNGGMGASPKHDGELACFPSNMGTTPIEIVETQAPLLVVEKRLLRDSAGPGRFRGGLGQRVTTRNIGQGSVTHDIIPCRLQFPARGVLGGGDAGVYRLHLNGEPHPRPQGRWTLRHGDQVTVDYPGGGGYGPPLERDRCQLLDDVLDGAVSRVAARNDYGLNAEQLRAHRASDRGPR